MPENLNPGSKYRNRLGAELTVTGTYAPRSGGFRVLSSDIYEAVAYDSLFGNAYYLVTARSMTEAGYEEVEPGA